MKSLILNTSDIQGGAARAAYRIHKGLKTIGHESYMLVQSKASDEFNILGPRTKFQKLMSKIRPRLDSLPLYQYRDRKRVIFTPAIVPDKLSQEINCLNPDIIHLHWIAGGFIRIESLTQFEKPIIWTLHDMWPFTGGCHYDGECGRYVDNCGSCPLLGTSRKKDLSYRILTRKNKSWEHLNLTIVSPSKWLADCARKSSLFKNNRVEVIQNGLDLNTFKPIDKRIARQMLFLNPDKKIILFGAMSATSDRRKGFQHLEKALRKLSQTTPEDYMLVVLGSSEPENPLDFGLECHYLGRLHDDVSLAILYSAADVFVAPSIQENLANTVVESLACGTPCVAFNIGGMPDMIDHKQNGYLAQPYESEDLARGIFWGLEDKERWKELSLNARQKAVENYDISLVARKYACLYEESLKK